MNIKAFIITVLIKIRQYIASLLSFPGRLAFMCKLYLGIWCLRSLDKFMKNKRYKRGDRRQVWRNIVTSAENRDIIFGILKTWKI